MIFNHLRHPFLELIKALLFKEYGALDEIRNSYIVFYVINKSHFLLTRKKSSDIFIT